MHQSICILLHLKVLYQNWNFKRLQNLNFKRCSYFFFKWKKVECLLGKSILKWTKITYLSFEIYIQVYNNWMWKLPAFQNLTHRQSDFASCEHKVHIICTWTKWQSVGFFSLKKKKLMVLSGTVLIINTYMYRTWFSTQTNYQQTESLNFVSHTKSHSYFQTLNNYL